MDHQTYPRLRLRDDGRCVECGTIVAIAADVEARFGLRPGQQRVGQHRADNARLVPRRHEDRRDPGKRARVQLRFIDVWGRNFSAKAQPAIGQVHGQFVQRTEDEKEGREEEQLVLNQRKPFASTQPRQ